MKMPRVRVAGILEKNDQILFIKHKKDDNEYWLLPGGGVDYGETFQTALEREFIEETGLKIKVGKMRFVSESIAPDLRRHIVNLFFEVTYVSGELKIGDEEILKEVKYLEKNGLKNKIIYPNIKEEIIKVENGIEYLGNRWE